MSQYPVEDKAGVLDGLNYLLSGPAGLGQNFQGFADYQSVYIRPTVRQPFTVPISTTLDPAWYISLPITDIQPIDLDINGETRKIEITFSGSYTNPPFEFGDELDIAGVTESGGVFRFKNFSGSKPALGSTTTYSNIAPTTTTGSGVGVVVDVTLEASGATTYDINNTTIVITTPGSGYIVDDTLTISGADLGGTSPANDLVIDVRSLDEEVYNGTGYRVFSSTSTSVVLFTRGTFKWATYESGGTVGRDFKNFNVSTDCNARVTIFGPTDQAFITCQFYGNFDYTCDSACDFDIEVKIDRYRGIPNPGSDDFTFFFDQTVSTQSFNFTPSTSGNDIFEAIFTTVLDTPGFGYYWYICQLRFNINGGLEQDAFGVSGTKPALGSTTTYSGVTPVNVSSSGTGAVLDIELFASGEEAYDIDSGNYNITIYIDTPGTDYQVDDVLKILGTDLGGVSPGNDLTLTVTSVTNDGNAQPGDIRGNLRSLTAQVVKE